MIANQLSDDCVLVLFSLNEEDFYWWLDLGEIKRNNSNMKNNWSTSLKWTLTVVQTQPRRGLQQQSTWIYLRLLLWIEVQCGYFKCRYLKNRYLKTGNVNVWKENIWSKWLVCMIWVRPFFWGLPCYLYSSVMAFELHFEPSNCSSMIADHASL